MFIMFIFAYVCVFRSAVEDMFGALNSGPKTAEGRAAIMAGPLTFFINRLVRMLDENPAKSGFFVGNSLTIADLKFHAFLNLCESGFLDHINQSVYENVPEVVAFKAKVEAFVAEKGFTFE